MARRVLEQVDSTNAEALRIACTVSGPTWIMAHRQVAGRGRRARTWEDPPGNFAATLVMNPGQAAPDVARLSFVAALAVHDAIAQVGGPHLSLTLKWPNDVLLNGAKLSGILLESAGTAGRVSVLAIGVGVNLTNAPDPGLLEPDALRPTSLLAETGMTVTPVEFLDRLAPAFDHWLTRLHDEGFTVIRKAWLARAAKLGETVTARSGNMRLVGRFEGIDATGALIMTTQAGRQVVSAADIHFGEV